MLARIISALIAVILFVASFYIYEAFGLLFAFFTVFAGFIFIFPLISGSFSDFLAALFMPGGGSQKVKEEFSLVKVKINNGEYDEAVDILSKHLEEQPTNTTAKSLLAKIYYEDLNQPNKVLEIFFEDLKLKTLSVEYDEMIQMSIDILLEQNRREDARRMITQCIPKVSNGMLRKKLKQRLKYI